MKTVRFGVIGAGGMGTYHINYLLGNSIKNCSLKAVCDIDSKRIAGFGNIAKFADSEALLTSGLVDAVIIATPHYSHTTIGISALRKGLHVLVEKPISVHKADCERLIGAHKNKKLIFAAMFQQRTHPAHIKIRKLIQGNELGRILRINWINTDWFRSEAYYGSSNWRATWKGEGGGVLLNQAPHNIDLFQWFFGMPSKVRAFCKDGKYHNIEVEDDVSAYFEYEDGKTAVFVTSTGECPGTNRLEVMGDMGRLVWEDGKLSFIRNEVPGLKFLKDTDEMYSPPPSWNITIPFPPGSSSHQVITQNFVDAILNGTPLIAPAREGINSVELANAMILSSHKNETVKLPMSSIEYEKHLKKLVAKSKPFVRKKTNVARDMSKSFK